MPVGKVLLRNVIRHTGAHNKVRPWPVGEGAAGPGGPSSPLSPGGAEPPAERGAGRAKRPSCDLEVGRAAALFGEERSLLKSAT